MPPQPNVCSDGHWCLHRRIKGASTLLVEADHLVSSSSTTSLDSGTGSCHEKWHQHDASGRKWSRAFSEICSKDCIFGMGASGPLASVCPTDALNPAPQLPFWLQVQIFTGTKHAGLALCHSLLLTISRSSDAFMVCGRLPALQRMKSLHSGI